MSCIIIGIIKSSEGWTAGKHNIMDKKNFYREQAEKFRDYATKYPDRDLLSIFEEWAESKDFSEEDRKEIWKLVERYFSCR